MLKQRVVSACLMAIGFIAALTFLPILFFKLFIAIVLSVAAWEWANLAGFKQQLSRILYALVVVSLAFLAGYFAQDYVLTGLLDKDVVKSVLVSACVWWTIALLWVQGYPASAILWRNSWVRLLMGGFVLVPTWIALAYLREQSAGIWMIVFVVAIVVIADIGAYFTGKALGRRKLAPNVSPGKSWEGFFGGLSACILFAFILAWATETVWWQMLAIVLPASLASVLGDLLESMVKRERGIKDSSQLLPGHGGVMDRIDSLTACAPVFALAVLASGWTLAG